MDVAGQQPLAHAGLAGNEDGAVHPGDAPGQLQHVPHGLALGHDMAGGGLLAKFLQLAEKLLVLLAGQLQAVFRVLELRDVPHADDDVLNFPGILPGEDGDAGGDQALARLGGLGDRGDGPALEDGLGDGAVIEALAHHVGHPLAQHVQTVEAGDAVPGGVDPEGLAPAVHNDHAVVDIIEHVPGVQAL